MTFEELKKKGYQFIVVHHSRDVAVAIQTRYKPVGTVRSPLRTEALEAARVLAITHFVENRIAE